MEVKSIAVLGEHSEEEVGEEAQGEAGWGVQRDTDENPPLRAATDMIMGQRLVVGHHSAPPPAAAHTHTHTPEAHQSPQISPEAKVHPQKVMFHCENVGFSLEGRSCCCCGGFSAVPRLISALLCVSAVPQVSFTPAAPACTPSSLQQKVEMDGDAETDGETERGMDGRGRGGEGVRHDGEPGFCFSII